MKICIITSIFHGFGKIGGFGVMARQLADYLHNQGHDVCVVVPRRRGQKNISYVNSYPVYGVSYINMINPLLYKQLDADIYHSQSPNAMSFAAKIGAPNKKHVITCRDPRNFVDWFVESRDATLWRRLKNIPLSLFEEGPLIRWTIKRANVVGYAATYLKEKIEDMYGVKNLEYLPNIEKVPTKIPSKSKKPSVLLLGRLDKRKHPEKYIELAKNFPRVTFHIVGKAENKQRHEMLKAQCKTIPNIVFHGYIDKYDKKFYDIINPCWILINTASREAYPLSFFEAASRGCSILSYVNPDDIANIGGYWAKNQNFAEGLNYLLQKNRWKHKGQMAHRQIKSMTANAGKRHEQLYERLRNENTRT